VSEENEEFVPLLPIVSEPGPGTVIPPPPEPIMIGYVTPGTTEKPVPDRNPPAPPAPNRAAPPPPPATRT
jgi:hypothetical protein